MSRPKGAKNTMPSKEIQRQLLRDVTRKALDGDVQAIGVVLNYTILLDTVKTNNRKADSDEQAVA